MKARKLGWLVFLAVLSGCGDGVGPTSSVVGGPCVGPSDCASSSRCLLDGDFPGGMCAVSCAGDAGCPEGSACVSSKGGVCLPMCMYSDECRPGYLCKGKGRVGLPGEVLVCIND